MTKHLLALVLLGGCASGTLGTSVMPNMETLPNDHRGAAILSSAAVRTTEGGRRQRLTKTERRVTIAAASAAAVIGWIFSTSDNATIGIGFYPDLKDEPIRHSARDDEPPEPPARLPVEAGGLVPWVELGPAPLALPASASSSPAPPAPTGTPAPLASPGPAPR